MTSPKRCMAGSLVLAAAILLFGASLAPCQFLSFRRGDSNSDGVVDVSDAIHLLGFLFLGSPPSLDCDDAADTNDSGELDLSDSIYELAFLFNGGAGIPAPGPNCGLDPTEDELLCRSYAECPPCNDVLIPPEDDCPGDVFVPDSPTEDWRHPISAIVVVSLGPPRHRALDAVVRPGDEQVLIGKFAYGPSDRDLTDETVQVWIRVACGQWMDFGSGTTSEDGEHPPVQGVVDDGGRIFFTIPPAMRLGQGTYAVKMLVKGDHSSADCRLHVWPAGTPAVVTDVDGALTDQEPPGSWESFDAASQVARAQSRGALEAYASKGIKIIYLSSRPEFLAAGTRTWLEGEGFPPGVVRLSLLSSAEAAPPSIAERGAYLAGLASGVGALIRAAYGTSAPDRAAYLAGGVPAASIALVGFDGEPQGVRVFEDWAQEAQRAICLPPGG